jgi:hypothetical protein
MLLIDASSMERSARPWHDDSSWPRALVSDVRTLTRDWDAPVHVIFSSAVERHARDGAVDVWESGMAGAAHKIGALASSTREPTFVVSSDPCAVRLAHLAGALVLCPRTLQSAMDRVCEYRARGVVHLSPLARGPRALLGLERARRWFAAAREEDAA